MTKKKPSKRNTRRASGAKRATREENQNSPQYQDGFPIVGVGASAGGLQALQAMPDEPGVAIVVIQHLDPTKKSLGPELLAKCTKMQVAEVADDPHVKPNRVYVLPPDKYLSISGGELHLSEPDQPRGTRRAIDFFLRSLAEDQQQCAVGVILSGSGTDGTLGIKAIKAAGGLVIAQDPTTAEHEGMPRSAIDSGAVDHVLPPDEIPGVLVRYAEHSYVREGPATPAEEREAADQPAAEESADSIQPIIAFLRAGTKHDFRNYKDKTLVRRTRRRMCLHHIDDYEAYLKYLREHPGEADALVKDLLITVTDFFREPEAWEELRKLAIRPMIEAKEDDEPIRVWTPGCATGEEPYSLAMLILEELKQAGKNCPLTVFASDIDKDAIAFAREGRYPRSIEADVSRERLRQFFAPVDGADYYHVNKSLREVVTFADQNLIADPPFSKLDLLCCRNLLIYLKGEVQEKIIALFHFALREGGVLFLGSAETIGRQTDLFQTLHKRWRIFRRVGPTQHNRVDIPISDVQQRREIDVQPAPPLRRETRLSHLAQQRLLDMLAPSAVLVDAKWRILYICGDVDPYLSLKAGLPTVDLLDNTRPGLRSKLRVVVQRALSEDRPTTVQARVQRAGRYHPVGITVHVVHDREADETLALVMFEEFETDRSRTRQSSEGTAQDLEANRISAHADPNSGESGYKKTEVDDLDDHVVIRQLEEELAATKADLQATVEQLESSNEEYKASNEEVMSINEELQSTNEELETSKEELQSLNEELSTVNNQLGAKVEELETKTSDLQNLLTATDVATICLDTDLAIRWFTPAVQELIRLREADKGRPLADFTDDFSNGELVKVAHRVLDKLTPVEDEARCNDGRTFLRRTTPYRTEDHRIGGVVITFFDITERKKAEVAIATAKDMAEKVVDTVRESMLVLDTELRVITANQSFYEKFQVSPTETEGRLVYELGNNQWDIPELRRLLEEILPENSVFNDYEVDHVFETIGRRVMRLNARRVDHIQRILLAIEDITEHRLAEGRRTFLLELMDAFRDGENPAELPEQATSRLRKFLRCQRAVYAELEVDENRANIIAQHAASDDELNTTHQLSDFGPEVLASLLEHGELVIDDMRSDPRCSGEAYRDAWERLGVRSLMCVARKTTADRVALVAVSFATPHQWHAEEFVLVRDVADRTWSAQNVARSDLALRESEERLRRAAEATGFGTYDYDVAGNWSIWSPEMYTILGVMASTEPNPQIIDQLVHPDDREMFRRGKQASLDPAGPGCHEMEFRIVRPDGQTRWIRDAGQTFFAPAGNARRAVRVVGTVQDITQRKETEKELKRLNESLEQQVSQRIAMLKLLQDITRIANEARTVEEAMLAAMERISRFNGWQVGHVWRLADDGSGEMITSTIWHISDVAGQAIGRLDEFQQVCAAHRFRPGEGLVGAVIASGEPKWINDVKQYEDWKRGSAERFDLHAAIAFPVTVNGEVVAVMEFFSHHAAKRDQSFMEIMPDVGIQLGHVIERRRLEKMAADATEAEQRRIGSDIHDGVGQDLTGLRYMAQTHAESLTAQSSTEVKTAQRMTEWLEKVQQQLRGIVRRLVPVEIDEQGLVAALHGLAEQTTETHDVVCHSECAQSIRVPDTTLATHIYRIAQEAVRNAVQHAEASQIWITLSEDAGELKLQVEDDGIGIKPAVDQEAGFGLRSMAYRAGLIGAQFECQSREEGGTRVTCVVSRGPRFAGAGPG